MHDIITFANGKFFDEIGSAPWVLCAIDEDRRLFAGWRSCTSRSPYRLPNFAVSVVFDFKVTILLAG